MISTVRYAAGQSDTVRCYNKAELQVILRKLIQGEHCEEQLDLVKKENVLLVGKVDTINLKVDELSKAVYVEEKRKRNWRTATLVTASVAAILTIIIAIK